MSTIGNYKGDGVTQIILERIEQLVKHGRTIELDFKINKNFELAYAAQLLIKWPGVMPKGIFEKLAPPKGWDEKIFLHMMQKPYKDRLVIAGALLAAEIDRLQYLEHIKGPTKA